MTSPHSRIEDYAFLSDGQGSVLVARDGSVDWLCLPRFDSEACFAALLGKPENGRWLLAPRGAIRQTHRRYREGTLILESTYVTDEGEVTLVDFMPPRRTNPDLIRIVVGKRGRVPMHCELTFRFAYGSIVPWVERADGSLLITAGPDSFRVDTELNLRGEDLHTVGDFTIGEGERRPLVLTWYPSHQRPPPPTDAEEELQHCEAWWKAWVSHCTYEGPYREAVVRSAVTLKGLIYEPTGGIVAAPTTSLPEHIGGNRNWDYRYCWLRDATFVLYALRNAGYTEEAVAFRNWLERAVAGKASQVQPIYGVAGERRLMEYEADWLTGYEDSRPVRIGNAAHQQLQLDVFGEIMDSLHFSRRASLGQRRRAWSMQRLLVNRLGSLWQQPDSGIWEVRGGPRQFTYSKVLAWVAMDRAVKAVEDFGFEGDVGRWRQTRQQIHDEVCQRGFDRKLGAFVQSYGSQNLDASLLIIPMVGFLPASDARVRGTVEAIATHLMRDGLVARYSPDASIDGLGTHEGAFLLCSFWLADNWALQGNYGRAVELFEHLLSLRNDVGLLSEEYDPKAKRFLGNFPQGFSHVALINSAYNLLQPEGPSKQRAEA